MVCLSFVDINPVGIYIACGQVLLSAKGIL